MSTLSVSGLSSGLDTESIVTQLMAIERAPLTKMNADVAAKNQEKIAWTKLSALAQSLAGKAADLSSQSRLFQPVASSTNADIASVTGSAAAGSSVSFTVSQLARSGMSALSGFTSSSDVVGAGTVTVTTASGTSTLTLGAGATVADLAAAVAGTGKVSTAVVPTGDATLGTEVLFTSAGTGKAAEATVSFSGFAQSYATSTVRSAQDAQIQIGGQTLTRASNTIDDLLPGATVTLKKAGPDEVTLSSARDDAAITGKVQAFVDGFNDLLSNVATFTKNVAGATDNGALAGDPRLRALTMNLTRAITDAYGTGSLGVLSQVGIRVERTGSLSFDKSTFATALSTNPDGVADLLTRTGTSSNTLMSFRSATAGATPGSYAVSVTAAATQASTSFAVAAPLAADTAFTFTTGTHTATFTGTAGATGADLATSMQTWLNGNGYALDASWDGTQVAVRSRAYGSAQTFTLSSAPTGSVTATGTDVAGTINGQAASGVGRTLTATGAGAAAGLAVDVSASSADVAAAGGTLSVGTLKFDEGVGGFLSSMLNSARDANGTFPTALAAIDSSVRDSQANIKSFSDRMNVREANMRAKFTALEVALARMKQQTPDFSSLSNLWSSK